MHAIEEVEPGPIRDKVAIGFMAGSEEDGGGKNPLKALHHAVVTLAIFEEAEEVKYLGGGPEAHNAAALAQGQGGDPNRDEPVLAVRKPKLRVADDLEKGFAVTAGMGSLVSRGTS